MTTSFNPDIHHRQTVRLKAYDYSQASAYFITVCTHERECLFGGVADGEIRLNGFGEIVREEWLRSAEIRQEIEIDAFVVMPNHLHGIIVINNDVGATRWVAQNNGQNGNERATHRVAPTGPDSGSIGAIIGQFKSIVTKRINALRDNPGCPVWQRNYYERVIRNERELAGIREYIANNPLQWSLDRENPANVNKP
jgi:putative transposase